jgi:hypothetical protein
MKARTQSRPLMYEDGFDCIQVSYQR